MIIVIRCLEDLGEEDLEDSLSGIILSAVLCLLTFLSITIFSTCNWLKYPKKPTPGEHIERYNGRQIDEIDIRNMYRPMMLVMDENE